jgi:hypothetical protein
MAIQPIESSGSFSGKILQERINQLIAQVKRYDVTLSPVLVAANTTAEQTFTVTGLKTTSLVVINKPTAQAGLGIVGVRVSAADTLAITFSNNTASGITPTASQVYKVVEIKA